MATQFKLRRDTASTWASVNPVLAQGEPGFESDTGKLKIGNGLSAWNALNYMIDYGSLTQPVLITPKEKVTVSATAATGTINFDASTQAVLYYTTNASANFTLNFRGASGVSLDSLLSTGQAVTLVFMCTNGATAYYPSAHQIDGTSQTIKWVGGSAPTAGNASAIDIYTYTIIKTGTTTFTVIGSQTKAA